jgi:hypothetical protein
MSALEWKTSGTTLKLTAGGTIVGMPAIRAEASFGLSPIVPHDDPEDELGRPSEAPWRSVARRRELPLPPLPTRRVMPLEERRLLARAATAGSFLVMLVAALVYFAA